MTLATTLSLTRTANEQIANSPLIRPAVCFDGGNCSIQWLDLSGQVCQIPSHIKPIDTSWEDVEPDVGQSPSVSGMPQAIAVRSIICEFEGETFAIGQVAKDMGGNATFQGDQIALARRLVLAALEPNPGSDAVRIERLLIALPNSRNDVSLLKAIEGTFEYCRNGRAIVATVQKVEPIDETRAAYRYATAHGLFLSQKQVNGILDLGGGTSIARLYSTSGSLIREADIILPGTADLARRIAARISRDLPASPDLTLILDGIEDGSFQLGTTGYSFTDAFETARAEWIADIRAQIKTRWGRWLPNLV